MFVIAAPVVVRTPRLSVTAGVGAGIGVARVFEVDTTGGCSGAVICLTFAFAKIDETWTTLRYRRVVAP